MSNFSDLNTVRKKLEEALGDNAPTYFAKMKQWFQMKCTREEFNFESRKLMSNEQIHLHNEFLLSLFKKCQLLSSQSNTSWKGQSYDSGSSSCKKSKGKKKFRSDRGGFEPADYVDLPPERLTPPPQPYEDIKYCDQEVFLPDTSLIFGRLMLAAWERGLEGAEENAAEFLVAAVQHLLKNVLTAVLTRKNGYKIREGRYIHGMGTTVPNPWIRNTIKAMNCNKINRFDVEEDDDLDDFEEPLKKPTLDDVEQKAAYEIACGPDNSKTPITAYHILQTLQVYPHIIPSDGVYSAYVERVISKLRHPTRDEIDAGT